MVARAASRRKAFRGLRRLDMSRDLKDIAELIGDAFGDEPDQAGQNIASELRSLSRWSALLWLLERLDPTFQGSFTGFVWVEDGRVVGNVTLSRESAAPGRWLVSNVVVARGYRQRGIARQLMEASLDFLKTQRARTAFLMVRRANAAAVHLYRSLGFSEVGGRVTLTGTAAAAAPPEQHPLDSRWTLRDARLRDSRELYALVRVATPEPLLRARLTQGEALLVGAEPKPGDWLRTLLGRPSSCRWVLEGQGRIVAYLRLDVNRKKHHRIRLAVHPAVRGQVELPLLVRALQRLGGSARTPVLVDVGSHESGVLEALRRLGFEESRWLVVMVRRMDAETVVEV